MGGERAEQAARARELVRNALNHLNEAVWRIETALDDLGEAIVAWPLLAYHYDMAGAELRKGGIETEAEMLKLLLAYQEAWQDGPIAAQAGQ